MPDRRGGEWRTNAALGAQVEPVEPPPIARTLALAARGPPGPTSPGSTSCRRDGGFLVLELNGAVDFRPLYAPQRNVFSDAVAALLDDGVQRPELAAASV